MESGRVTNQQIRASSKRSWKSWPPNARLNLVKGEERIGAWEPSDNDENPYLLVDFERNVEIKKIATQGREDDASWVKKYRLFFAKDGEEDYQPYKENDAVKVITTYHTSDP